MNPKRLGYIEDEDGGSEWVVHRDTVFAGLKRMVQVVVSRRKWFLAACRRRRRREGDTLR